MKPVGSRLAGGVVAAAVLAAIVLAACGGTGSGTADTLDCPFVAPVYRGGPLHAQLPATAFPVPPAVADANRAPLPDDLLQLLDARIEQIRVSTGTPAITASLQVPGLGRWSATRGLARLEPPAVTSADTLFYWASVSKVFTAVLVLQLVETGQIRLDDRLERWFPSFPQAAQITVEQLLTHTSGLATNALDGSDGPAESLAGAVVAAERTLSVFCPGTGASYSNIGYLLLALIVEAVERRPFDEVLQRRIAEPLGLVTLRLFRAEDAASERLVTPHLGRRPVSESRVELRPGAGSVVGAADDVVSAWRAVLEGRLLAPATVQQQWRALFPVGDSESPTTANTWFGQGTMLMEWSDANGRHRTWLGHLGGTPAISAAVLYDPLARAHLAVATNSEVSAAAVANALLDVLMAWRAGPPVPDR